jgi:hypothetical protein
VGNTPPFPAIDVPAAEAHRKASFPSHPENFSPRQFHIPRSSLAELERLSDSISLLLSISHLADMSSCALIILLNNVFNIA